MVEIVWENQQEKDLDKMGKVAVKGLRYYGKSSGETD